MASTAIKRRRAQRQAEILDAAWELAERQGIALLSMRDLARAVGMRAPSLYEYFDSKDAIYDAMFTQGYEELQEAMADLTFAGSPVRELLVGTEAFLDFCAASLPRYQLMFTRAIPGWEPTPQAFQASLAAFDQMADQLATAGVTDPAHLDLWTAIGSGLAAQQAANDPGGDRYRRLAQLAAEMFLNHVTDRRERHDNPNPRPHRPHHP